MKIINDCKKDSTPAPVVIPEEEHLFVTKDDLENSLKKYSEKRHQHPTTDIIGFKEALNQKSHVSHNHNVKSISGLEEKLDEKASKTHEHTINDVYGLLEYLSGKSPLEHTHSKSDIEDLEVFSVNKEGLVPKAPSSSNLFLTSGGTWKEGLSLSNVSNALPNMLPVYATRWPSFKEVSGDVSDVLPEEATRWPKFSEISGNISSVLPITAKRWPTFSEIGGRIEDVLPANFNDPIEFGDIVGDVDDILPETAKRWPTYGEIEGEIESQLTDHALRWPSWLEVTGDIRTVLPEQGKRWPYYTEILGDIEDYLPETALRWPRFDEILGSFLGLLPETAIRWPTLEELGITNIDGGTVVIPPNGDSVESPVTPFNFTANAGIDFVLLSWNLPRYNGHAYTEIYRFTDDVQNPVASADINDAVKIGETTGFIYTDQVDVGSAHYYWIRFVNLDGEYSDFTPVGGLYAQTALNYDALIGKARQDVLDSLEIWKNSIREALDILDNNHFDSILNIQGNVESLSDQVLLTENRLKEQVLLSENLLGTKYDEYVDFTQDELTKSATRVTDLTASIFETDANGNVILDGTGGGALAGAFITSVDNVTASKFEAEAESRKQIAAAIFQVNDEGEYLLGPDGKPVLSGAFSDTIETVTASEFEATAQKIETLSSTVFVYDENGFLLTNEDGSPQLTGAFKNSVTDVTATRFESEVEAREELVSIMFQKNNDGTIKTDANGNPLFASGFSTSVDNVTATSREVQVNRHNQLAAVLFAVDADNNPVIDSEGNPVLAGGFSNKITNVTSTEVSAIASDIENLTASVFARDENGDIIYDSDGNPSLVGSFTNTLKAVAVDATSATAAKIDKISSSMFVEDEDGNLVVDEDGNAQVVEAFIDKVDATLAASDSEVMSAIGSTIGVERDGERYTLSEIMSLSLSTDGKLESQWGVKTTINDLQYGVGFVTRTDDNGNKRTGFHVAADTFSVHNPANGEEVFPLIIDEDGHVLIANAVIDTATITDLVAETIITKDLFAGESITSPVINGGQININDKFIVDEEGEVEARNITIKDALGNTIMSSGTGVEGSYIRDLTVDTLKIKANAITVPLYIESSVVFTDHVWATVLDYSFTQEFTATVLINFSVLCYRQGDVSGSGDAVTISMLIYDDDELLESVSLPNIYADSSRGENFGNCFPLMASANAPSGNIRVHIQAKSKVTNQDYSFKVQGAITNAKR